jgi:hypothetical protein
MRIVRRFSCPCNFNCPQRYIPVNIYDERRSEWPFGLSDNQDLVTLKCDQSFPVSVSTPKGKGERLTIEGLNVPIFKKKKKDEGTFEYVGIRFARNSSTRRHLTTFIWNSSVLDFAFHTKPTWVGVADVRGNLLERRLSSLRLQAAYNWSWIKILRNSGFAFREKRRNERIQLRQVADERKFGQETSDWCH